MADAAKPQQTPGQAICFAAGLMRGPARHYAIDMIGKSLPVLALLPPMLALATPAAAQDSDVPYWASIRAEVVNMRVGPATSYRIEWVYKRPQLPVRVLRRKEGWRLIEDPDGARGWMLGRFLTLQRTAIVSGEGLADMRNNPGSEGRTAWRLEPGVIGKLGDCEAGWCRFEVGKHKGFAPEARLWGTGAP